jgi:hypothetical protein
VPTFLPQRSRGRALSSSVERLLKRSLRSTLTCKFCSGNKLMTVRPKADLDSLTVPKDNAPAPSREAVPPPKAYAHTLSLRLTADQYRRLRRYVAREEDETGRRTTQQAIIEAALEEYLAKHHA